VLSPVSLSAQQLLVSPLAEKTIVNYQLGAAAQLQSRSGWRAGAFYQQAITRTSTESSDRYWGILAAAPLVKSDKLTLYAAGRAGIVNRHFFTVAPALSTAVRLTKRLSSDLGLSYRKGYISAMLSLNLHVGL
jgi:hypothetical protein